MSSYRVYAAGLHLAFSGRMYFSHVPYTSAHRHCHVDYVFVLVQTMKYVNLLLALVSLAAVFPNFRLRHPSVPAVTVASVTLMVVLFLSETLMFIKVDTSSRMAVADFHDHDAVTARLHVTFPYIGCKGECTLLLQYVETCLFSYVQRTGMPCPRNVHHHSLRSYRYYRRQAR